MRGAVPMVEIRRGARLESLHLGHAVIVGPGGDVVDAWGAPDTLIYPRSSAKMIQALPLVESGAADALDAARLALACASHEGETGHIDAVRAWLADLGLDEDDLVCGPQASRNRDLRHQMIKEGKAPSPVMNNCSGKHTGFLMLTRHLGAGPDYAALDHPVQMAVREVFEDLTGETSPDHGIDGCSAPNFMCTVTGLARAMARFATADEATARGRAMLRLRRAMAAHPWEVAGTGRACTRLMEACEGRAIIKTGAEGVFVGILPETGRGIGLKIGDGATRASEIGIAALLIREGALDPDHPVAKAYTEKPIRNWDGLLVGVERPDPGWLTSA